MPVNLLTRIWIALNGDRRLMVWSVVFGLVFTGLGIIPPLLVGQMIRWLRHGTDPGNFVAIGLLLGAIYLLRGISRYLYGIMSHVAAYRTMRRGRLENLESARHRGGHRALSLPNNAWLSRSQSNLA